MKRAAPILAALTLGGCGFVADAPPAESPEEVAPKLVAEAPATKGITEVKVPTLRQDGFRRRAAAISVRVRNLSCQGVTMGSGFAIDANTLVTNRHVVAGAAQLEVNTADGRSLTVSTAQVGVLGDIAYIKVEDRLPVPADLDGDPSEGTEVSAVGYPLGGPFTITRGVVLDHVDGTRFGVPGRVMRITAEVQQGNSGGPLLDPKGRVAGVVFAYEVGTEFGLAMPMDSVESFIASGGVQEVPACGEQ